MRTRLTIFCLVVATVLAVSNTALAKKVDAEYASESNPAYSAEKVANSATPANVPAEAGGFIHPGVLVNRAQLDEIKKRVAHGIEPQKTAFERLRGSPFAALEYTP